MYVTKPLCLKGNRSKLIFLCYVYVMLLFILRSNRFNKKQVTPFLGLFSLKERKCNDYSFMSGSFYLEKKKRLYR